MQETAVTPSPSSPPAEGQEGDKDSSIKGKKKRLSGLATMISKKKVMNRAEIIAQQRSENELKSYASLSRIGRPIYTQIKRKRSYLGPTKDTELTEVKESKRLIKLHNGATATEIAKKLKVKFKDMADHCLDLDLLMNPDDFIGMKLPKLLPDSTYTKLKMLPLTRQRRLGKKRHQTKKKKI